MEEAPEGGREGNLKILFICIGNSCRSPMAESILQNMIKDHPELKWNVDSAALRTWNVGYSPEDRCIQILGENGLTSNHIGRRIELTDFDKFDYIFGMDNGNIRELRELAPANCKAKIQLLGEYGLNHDKIILDPYFEYGVHGFQRCYEQITKCCRNFVNEKLDGIRN